MRKFEELITEIEHDVERFVPIEVIARLAVKHRAFFDKNISFNSYFNEVNATYHCIVTSQNKIKLLIEIKNLNVNCYELFNENHRHNFSFYNQVQIVKNLIKWGFVDP